MDRSRGAASSDGQARGDDEATDVDPDAEAEASGQGAADVAGATAAHEAALKAHALAEQAVRAAARAKKDATEMRERAHAAKAGGTGLLAAWKTAKADERAAAATLKAARARRAETDAARKAAWQSLLAARAAAHTEEGEANGARADAFHRHHHEIISAPRQATEGLKGDWKDCAGVTNVRLASAQLPPLDGHAVRATDGATVRFEPLLGGTTVLVSGTGGMKTVRTLEWMLTATVERLAALGKKLNAELPLAFVTARINLAQKLEADLQRRGIDVRNYKSCPKGTSMEEWLNYPRVIISVEQVDKLEAWIDTYQNGVVVIDEAVTAASSLVNGATVRHPERTLRTLRKLAEASSYLVLMDADFDADGKGKALLVGLARTRPVLYVQTTRPSLPTTLLLFYEGVPEDKVAWTERMELSCRQSAAERRGGAAPEGNRTYIGVDWPSDVNRTCQKLRQWGVPGKGLHGKHGGGVRKAALADLDAFVRDADAFAVTSVAGIATDQNCKYRAGCVRLRSGDCAPGPRAALQKLGRLNRNAGAPLDPFTAPDGAVYPGGAIFVLLPGLPPDVKSDGGDGAARRDPRDRAANKLHGMRCQTEERRSSVRSTHSSAEQLYERHNQAYLQQGDGTYGRLPPGGVAHAGNAHDAATLAELEALDAVEDDDKQPHSYATKFFEMNALPGKSFKLARGPQLGAAERAELERLRGGPPADGGTREPTEDERVGEMTPLEQYQFVRERIEADGHAERGSPFWQDCYGWCEKDKARFEGGNIEEAYMTAWETLRLYEAFPDDGDYLDLFNDRDAQCVHHRGQMRLLANDELALSEIRGLKLQALSDPTAGGPRPAYKLPLLRELASALKLRTPSDLLQPRRFEASKDPWLAAHNRILENGGSPEDGSMAGAARRLAIRLGCTGIRHGERAKKPTTLLATVHAVLTQRCAMRLPPLKKNGARSTVETLEVEEMAPGWAERGLYWHAGLSERVPLGEYDARNAAWMARAAEADRELRTAAALAATDAMLDAEFLDGATMDVGAESGAPPVGLPHYTAPYDPNVCYVHYEAAALDECLGAWGADAPQRRACAAALLGLIATRAALPGIGDGDAELRKLRTWRSALQRLETRHRIAAELAASLPDAPADGPLKGARVAREEYVYTADGEARRYAKGERWRDGDGEWRSATSQGMPSDLRTKLLGWRMRDKDGRKSDLTIYVIAAYLLGLPRTSVDVLIDEYLVSDEQCDAWHDGVARHHGVAPGDVKRWPNILGNGGSHKTCLTAAGLPRDGSTPDPRVERMAAQLRQLRARIARASRERPNALWPGSEHFVNRHDARLQRERPGLNDRERFNKVFSYLIQTAEDKILTVHAQAQRATRREALGAAEFDAMEPQLRDTGGCQFDGLMAESVDGCDPQAGDRAAEAALVRAGWHAQPWGVEYKIVEKPLHGLQRALPDAFESATAARAAMREACEAHAAVREAVANPTSHRAGSSAAERRNASVIPVWNGKALLAIQVRDGQRKHGLLGGKAEPGETLAETAAREAHEGSSRLLSDAARTAISSTESAAFTWVPRAETNVALVPVGGEDANAPSHFDPTRANRNGSTTGHVGIEWVALDELRDFHWRRENMHYHQSVLACAVRDQLDSAAAAARKRSRDAFEDVGDDELNAHMDAFEESQ